MPRRISYLGQGNWLQLCLFVINPMSIKIASRKVQSIVHTMGCAVGCTSPQGRSIPVIALAVRRHDDKLIPLI
jgi:hypothetical protein